MDKLDRCERKVVVLAMLFYFMMQMTNMQMAHRRRLLNWPGFQHDDFLKLCSIVIVVYNFINLLKRIHYMYTKQLINRIPMESREIIRRNRPEPRTLFYYEQTVLRFSDSTFRSHFRLTRSTFSNLTHLLGPFLASNVDGCSRGRPNTPVEKQILPVLWLLATPESYRSVADRFDISKGTLVLFVNRLVEMLNGIASRYIRWPRPNEMDGIRNKFYKIARFDKWVIGAIDGTFVVVPAPKEDPEVFRTRKSNFAVTLQAICTATLHFTSCFAGFPASVGDRRIFENSPIYQEIMQSTQTFFPNNEFLIGDKAYPVLKWLQAPYIRRFALNEAQEIYNHSLSATRQVIERAFGLLFGRFRRLKFLDMNKSANIPNTIIACCVLHNMCLSEDNYDDFIQEGMPTVWENATTGDDYGHCRNVGTTTDGEKRRGDIAARLHRDKIKRQMK